MCRTVGNHTFFPPLKRPSRPSPPRYDLRNLRSSGAVGNRAIRCLACLPSRLTGCPRFFSERVPYDPCDPPLSCIEARGRFFSARPDRPGGILPRDITLFFSVGGIPNGHLGPWFFFLSKLLFIRGVQRHSSPFGDPVFLKEAQLSGFCTTRISLSLPSDFPFHHYFFMVLCHGIYPSLVSGVLSRLLFLQVKTAFPGKHCHIEIPRNFPGHSSFS